VLVGIAGPKRSGKDTLAAGLHAALGWPVDSFAGPMRRFVADALGMTLAELEERKETPIDWLDGVTPRHMLQTVGTEWGRDTIHGELWVRSLLARMGERGIVSDVRFPNEARAIIDAGGVVIRLSRPGTGTGDAHISETPLPSGLVTYELRNSGTPEELVSRAMVCLCASPRGYFGGMPRNPPATETGD